MYKVSKLSIYNNPTIFHRINRLEISDFQTRNFPLNLRKTSETSESFFNHGYPQTLSFHSPLFPYQSPKREDGIVDLVCQKIPLFSCDRRPRDRANYGDQTPVLTVQQIRKVHGHDHPGRSREINALGPFLPTHTHTHTHTWIVDDHDPVDPVPG